MDIFGYANALKLAAAAVAAAFAGGLFAQDGAVALEK
jgi:hypothetical protein